jgi:malate dehydrogenase
MKRVSIIGGGNVGTNTAFFLAENGTASVTLVDVKEGVPVGKALDLMEAGPLRGYDTTIAGTNDIERIAGSDVVLVAAGRVRKPGEQRLDLYKDNAEIVAAICPAIARLAPDAVVVNIVEPIDSITLAIQQQLGYDRRRVLGVGGLLSSTRIRYLVSSSLGVSPREVTALIVGPHRESMVVLKDTIRVSGIPAAKLLGEERLDAIVEEARGVGDTILRMAQSSTAYYAPSAAACRIIEAIVRDTHAILPVSVRLEGEYGVRGLCIGVPARIGSGGAEAILETRLTEDETRALRAAVAELKAAIERATGRPIA